ncbi:SDR family oxidoreductase [Azotosporobacter soli]|uniref:SDR family oxidoreductase n=1 Tax=Azotosporobacter soli TaxID=3055040 RepID=UPI0031FE79B6
MKKEQEVVLITGASSGIGRAMAERLTAEGFRVYGTSRKPKMGQEGWTMLTLDVCEEESVQDAVREVLKDAGRIDVLINNAGYGDAGAVEDTSLAEAKRQFETNFFGVLRMCRAVLPQMRRQGNGKIINVGSVAGFIAVPFFGMYCASKAALAAMSESLRMEVEPFGICVALLEPGDIKTEGAGNIVTLLDKEESPYQAPLTKAVAVMAESEKDGIPMHAVTEAVLKMVQSKRMPLRCVVDWRYRLMRIGKRLLPDAWLESIVMKLHR